MDLPTKRRLTAILSADAVGFTRLMAVDEVRTVETLRFHRTTMGALIGEYGGRVVDAVGDNLLAEFPSVVDAVACAVEIQRSLRRDNRQQNADRRMEFRIGVNIGDLILDGDGVAGNGVNVAARLEALAEPGHICISGAALDQVTGKIELDCEDLGEVPLKHVPSPVRAYKIRVGAIDEPRSGANLDARLSVPGFSRQPAVAVLPFHNVGEDPDQDYISDGVAEDLIARLASCCFIPVIDRGSSFLHRGPAVDARQAGESLGARYVVAGSIRIKADNVRIAVRLVDAISAYQLWSQRFDRRGLDDIFEVQDEITETIIGLLAPALLRAERSRTLRKPPSNLGAWDCVLRALWHIFQGTREENAKARSLAQRASGLDPHFSSAFAALAVTHIYPVLYQWNDAPLDDLREAIAAAERGVALDDANPIAHSALGFALALSGSLGLAAGSLRRAVELNPSFALTYYGLGIVDLLRGKTDTAIGMFTKAIRLSPQDPMLYLFLSQLAQAHFTAERYDDAVRWARRSIEKKPDPEALRTLGASLGYLGDSDNALAAVDQMFKLQPGFSVEMLRNTVSRPLADRYLEGWRKAGWTG